MTEKLPLSLGPALEVEEHQHGLLISLAIAFATVLWQTLKAAKTNPAIELKKE